MEVKMDNSISFISTATSWLVDHKKRLLVNISSILMLIGICGVLGAFDFMSMSFVLERLLNIRYWSHIIARVVCLICALNLGINVFQVNAEEKNLLLQRDAIRYDKLIAYKEQNSFEYYITLQFSIQEKKKAWISKINKKIYTLGKFFRDTEKMLWSVPQEKLDSSAKLAKKKAKSLYCKKRAIYEEMKTDEWLDKNIDALRVHSFRAIDPSIFDLSINGKEKYSGFKLTSHSAIARGQKTITSILWMLMFSMLITIIGLDINEALIAQGVIGWISATVNAVMDVLFVLWQFYRGAKYTAKLVEEEQHRPYIDRIRILISYFTSNKSPVENFSAVNDTISQEAMTIILKAQDDLKRAKEEKDIKTLLKMRDEAQTRADIKDNFGGKIL